MKDWERKLDDFLRFNEREVLDGAGSISRDNADQHARNEFDLFAEDRRKQKEIAGEKDYLKQLEEAAKALPKPRRKGR